jgi:hypothetical protein
MNPQKLVLFSKNEMIPVEAAKYLAQIVDREISWRLKNYLMLELFPQIQSKVGKGI